MAKCDDCFFYETSYMWNGCAYFESECFYPPIECRAYSVDGNLSQEQEQKIYEETDGAFGKRKDEVANDG